MDREATFQRLMQAGVDHERVGRLAAAAARYLEAHHLLPQRGVPYLYLAYVLLESGHEQEAMQVVSLGSEVAPGLITAWRSPEAAPAVRARSERLDRCYRAFLTAANVSALEAFERSSGAGPLPRLRSMVWCQTHDRPFAYRHRSQRPWLLYLPDLAPLPWFDPSELPGTATLQAALEPIAEEATRALEEAAAATVPYVAESSIGDFGGLRGSTRWSSLHLYKLGRPAEEELLARFPATQAALADVDLVRLVDQPMEVFLSVLAPETHIPPHYGVANTRLTVHLPLVVPPGCYLEVCGERRAPVRGRVLAFDDSFEHQAGNPSGEQRVHLIFEAWRPDLTEAEKRGLEACLAARQAWNEQRRLPDLGALLR